MTFPLISAATFCGTLIEEIESLELEHEAFIGDSTSRRGTGHAQPIAWEDDDEEDDEDFIDDDEDLDLGDDEDDDFFDDDEDLDEDDEEFDDDE